VPSGERSISNAKKMELRVPLYHDLVKVTRKTIGYARRTGAALSQCKHRVSDIFFATTLRSVQPPT
jgi:hypothetical protein